VVQSAEKAAMRRRLLEENKRVLELEEMLESKKHDHDQMKQDISALKAQKKRQAASAKQAQASAVAFGASYQPPGGVHPVPNAMGHAASGPASAQGIAADVASLRYMLEAQQQQIAGLMYQKVRC